MESLWGAGKRGEGWGWVEGQREEMKRKEKDVPSALMWRPQHGSCSSQKEEREIEQINTDHQNLPLHLLLHPCPHGLMFEWGMQRGRYMHALYSYFWGVRCVLTSLHKMESTYCGCHSAEGLRDTSPLCTIHPLTLKHSDNHMRASHIPTHDRTLPFITLSQQFFSKHKSVGNCMVFHFTKSCVMDIHQKGKKQWVWFCRRSYSKKSFATTQ